jgi:hypothetical protein
MFVKLYGGPGHGQLFEVDNRGDHFHYAIWPKMDTSWKPAPIEPSLIETVTYKVHKYQMVDHYPLRRKVLLVGLMDGAGLMPDEFADVERRLWKQKWEVEKANILDDFDQWFAESVYRNMGWLTWKGVRQYA